MNIKVQIKTILLYFVFICYIVLLLKILFFSRISFSELFDSQRTLNRSINLIPFSTIGRFMFSSSADIKRFAIGNVLGNILVFLPLGTYLSLFKKDKRLIASLFLVFVASLFTEIVQGFLGIGTSDIDDIILNSIGGLIGILVYKLLRLILRDENKVHTAIAILSALGLPVIFYLLFMIQMNF